MDRGIKRILFLLIRSAISGEKLTDGECRAASAEELSELFKLAEKHDVDHLVAQGLRQNGLLPEAAAMLDKCILKAVYR